MAPKTLLQAAKQGGPKGPVPRKRREEGRYKRRNHRRKSEEQEYIGRAAFEQGLYCNSIGLFEEAASSLEAAWSAWKPIFMLRRERYLAGKLSPASEASANRSTPTSDEESDDDDDAEEEDEEPKGEPIVVGFRDAQNQLTPKEAAVRKLTEGHITQGGTKLKPDKLPGRQRRVDPAEKEPVYLDENFQPLPPSKGPPPVDWQPTEVSADAYSDLVDIALWQELLNQAEEELASCAAEMHLELEAARRFKHPKEEEEILSENASEEFFGGGLATILDKRYQGTEELEGYDGEMLPPPKGEKVLTKASTRELLKEQKNKERNTPKEYQLDQLVQGLCLALVRLQRWVDIDNFCAEVLPYFIEAEEVKLPTFKRESTEDLWLYVITKRGVACAFIGGAHLRRGQGYLEQALRVQPRNRSLVRALQSLRFLEKQLPAMVGQAHSGDAHLAQALAALM